MLDTFLTSFSIGDVVLQLRSANPIYIDANFKPFQTSIEHADVTVDFCAVENLSDPSKEKVSSQHGFDLYLAEDCFVRVYHDLMDGRTSYALGIQNAGDPKLTVHYLKDHFYRFLSSKGCFSHIPLDEVLIHWDRMIIHAALVNTAYGGILFCGPSGIGKSTQADLWNKFENSKIINGDRPIVGKCDEIWMAYGSPYAGSSGYFINERTRIATIVILEQANSSKIRRLGQAESVRRLFSNTVMNSWNREATNRVCDLLLSLSREIPIYHLACTPDKSAVEILKRELSKEE